MTRINEYQIFGPTSVTLIFLSLMVTFVILISGGDPLELVRIGTLYSENDPNGTEGYDGQFAYYIALDPRPLHVEQHLDVPAYRYQRILLPFIVRIASFGHLQLIPWIFPLVTIIFHGLGTYVLTKLLVMWNINGWYALIYGLWVGFSLAVRLNLPETLAFAFVLSAMLAFEKKLDLLASVLLGLALFSKETTILFIIAIFMAAIFQRFFVRILGIVIFVIIPYILFQLFLFENFGSIGIGSGGAMATGFEIIPLLGFFRIGNYSVFYMMMMFVVFFPSVIAPAIWGTIQSIRKIIHFEITDHTLSMFLNSLAIFFLPFSTYRETGGLLRYSCGLVLALILFSSKYKYIKILNYSLFWIVYTVFLLKS